MSKQLKIDSLYMDLALRVAKQSYCERKKVGCVIVTEDESKLFIGYNGTATGSPNVCELENGLTSPDTIHAEINALRKAYRQPDGYKDTKGSTLYVTHSPCIDCAQEIIDNGISRVVFLLEYKCQKGVEMINAEEHMSCAKYGECL